MVKYLVIALIALLLGLGLFLVNSNQKPSIIPNNNAVLEKKVTTNSPSKSASEASTPEEDLTALDKDLTELDSAEEAFSDELNGL